MPLPPQGERHPRPTPEPTVPLRLLVHFQTTPRALVQVTEARREGDRLVGAGTHAVDTANVRRRITVFDPVTGEPTDETVTIAHVLAILYSISKVKP